MKQGSNVRDERGKQTTSKFSWPSCPCPPPPTCRTELDGGGKAVNLNTQSNLHLHTSPHHTTYSTHRIHARKRTQQGYLTCRPHIHRRRILCVCMCLGQQDNMITSGPSYASTGWMGANIMTEGTTVADDHHMSLTHSLTHMDMGSPCTCSFDSMSYGTHKDHGEWHAPHHIDRSQVVDASKRAHHGKCVRVAAPLSVFFLRW